MRIKLLIIIFVLLQGMLCAQNRTSNWFFSDGAGLKFNEHKVEELNIGKTYYQEGLSSISDINGNLLFYTEGENIWNKNHVLMQNGTGLAGHYSSTQGSIIVQKPHSCNLYYVFTLDAYEHGYKNGLQYSIVDMNLDNGNGDVLTKNQLLYSYASEKLCAAKSADNESIWIISHEMYTNQFKVYQLTENGLNETPVNSFVGTTFVNGHYGLGQMKITVKGDKLSYTAFVNNVMETFDFDNTTGIISNPQQFSTIDLEGDGGYGLEFSPSGRYLYFTKFVSDYLNNPGYLYQMDLEAGTTEQIKNSIILIGNNKPPSDMRGLQLALDGKIYVANSLSKSIGIIEEPDLAGKGSDYQNDGKILSRTYATWTFPNFMASYLFEFKQQAIIDDMEVEGNCISQEIKFNYTGIESGNKLLWNFGDQDSIVGQSAKHIYQTPGNYLVSLSIEHQCISDTLIQNLNLVNCNNKIYVPNAFSPNGDGINDKLTVFGEAIQTMDFHIYDQQDEQRSICIYPECSV